MFYNNNTKHQSLTSLVINDDGGYVLFVSLRKNRVKPKPTKFYKRFL